MNYLKLAASEVSKNTGKDKTYGLSIYDEENGNLRITHYKGWSISNPVQNLFLIETKDPELNKQKIAKFWLSYAPNNVDGNAAGIDVVVYFKDPVPDQGEEYCKQNANIVKGISTQAQFADAMEQMVFYGALGLGSVEALGSIKATECISGFTLDVGFQMGINAIVKRFLNENFTTKQLMKEVSLPSAVTSCATAALVNKCGTGCAGISGFAVGFSDDVLNQMKSGRSLSDVEVSQSTLNGIKQGILNIVVQKVVTFGISKFSAWRGKYTEKQVEDALEDLQAHPEKYGLEGNTLSKNVEDVISKKVLKYVSKYDKKLNKMVDYPMYNNVALGKSAEGALQEFGDRIGANVWTKETDNVITSMYDLPSSWSFERSITNVLKQTTEKNHGKILFDVNNVEIPLAIKGGLVHNAQLVIEYKLVTELELQMILRNSEWFRNTIFHKSGVILTKEELISKQIKLIE
ncbi:hypothetical protein [Flavobacterium anhuiense]|uniref:hypothetical protein n=1 Tax=Flavobacterium anhuiense TaxID=459526 RepID=UPI002025DDFA|nr:hypothetical protein [Flavobacterium anhuiense]URM35544.1 hypothetical protein LLY39_13935 [Flavobacterium anhuiense]